jgi:hypothetical protein
MATSNTARPSIFAVALRDYRMVQGLTVYELAICMIAHGFPSDRYSGDPRDSTGDRAFLAQQIQRIEGSALQDPWPFPSHEAEFVRAASACLVNIFNVRRRLLLAMTLDALAHADP